MKSFCFSFFHSYLSYGNIAWCSASMAKFKKIFSKQKQAVKAISMASLDYKNLVSEEIMDRLGILNIYKLNIYHKVNLMFRVKKKYHTRSISGKISNSATQLHNKTQQK